MCNVLFSIVVPIYGVEKYINQCIESILSQTYTCFELILVDDGSIDNCPTICDDYSRKDSRIVVIHKKNGGLVSARQAGARIAVGEYVICVDGDDWLEPDYLQSFYEIIKNEQPDMICCGYYRSYSNKDEPVKFQFPIGLYNRKKINKIIIPHAIHDENAACFPQNLWAKAIKRDIYVDEQLSINPIIKIGEDGACIKPLLYKIDTLYLIDSELYHYRINCESMTKVKSVFTWDSPIIVGKHIISRLHEQMNDPILKKEIYLQVNRLISHSLFRVTCSQFNSNKKDISKIKRDINKNLSSRSYSSVINKAKFKCIKGKMMILAMKYRLYYIMFLYSKL